VVLDRIPAGRAKTLQLLRSFDEEPPWGAVLYFMSGLGGLAALDICPINPSTCWAQPVFRNWNSCIHFAPWHIVE